MGNRSDDGLKVRLSSYNRLRQGKLPTYEERAAKYELENGYASLNRRILDTINDLISRYIPRKKPNQKCRKKALCTTNKAVQFVRKKYKAFAQHADSLYPAYIRAAKATDKEVRDAKANFEKRLADNIKTDSKSFFAYFRERNKTKVKVGPLINGTRKKMEDAHGMADEFNTNFTSVFMRQRSGCLKVLNLSF